MIWAGRKDDDVPAVATAREAALHDAEDEYRRLLYVAMTRAADRLIICGADGVRGRPKRCWYDLMRAPLETFLVEEEDYRRKDLALSQARRWTAAETAAAVQPAAPPKARDFRRGCGNRPPCKFRRRSCCRRLRRSKRRLAYRRSAASATDRQKALERGRVVHRLMQSLPDMASERRGEAAAHYLKGAASDFAPQEQDAIATKVLAIIGDEKFAQVFARGSRAEVPIVGQIPRTGAPAIAVAGQVDRLTVTEDAVLIADYKTDRTVPRKLDDVPPPYVAQLALYRAVLARIYPDKTVRAALVFTEGPHLIEVPIAAMQAALEALMARGHAAVKVP